MLKLTEVVSHVVGKVCSSSFNMIRHGEGIKDGTSGRPSTIAKMSRCDTRKIGREQDYSRVLQGLDYSTKHKWLEGYKIAAMTGHLESSKVVLIRL